MFSVPQIASFKSELFGTLLRQAPQWFGQQFISNKQEILWVLYIEKHNAPDIHCMVLLPLIFHYKKIILE